MSGYQCPASGCLVDPPTVTADLLPCPSCGQTVRVDRIGGTPNADRYAAHQEPTLGDMVARYATSEDPDRPRRRHPYTTDTYVHGADPGPPCVVCGKSRAWHYGNAS